MVWSYIFYHITGDFLFPRVHNCHLKVNGEVTSSFIYLNFSQEFNE